MTLRLVLEHLAVAFGAATGVLAGRGKQIDLFGVIVLGLVTAMGGGTLRDLILDVPVYWVESSSFVVIGVLAAGAMFFAVRFVTPPSSLLQVADAFFLAFVVMLGTSKTANLGHAWPICLVLGLATGVAGGILRDVLCGQIPLVFRTHINLYATAGLAGAACYLLLHALRPGQPLNLLVGAGVTVGLRLIALRWQLRLPELRTADTPDESANR
jgi:uncharacterized membrane protein YeiH